MEGSKNRFHQGGLNAGASGSGAGFFAGPGTGSRPNWKTTSAPAKATAAATNMMGKPIWLTKARPTAGEKAKATEVPRPK